MNYLIWGVFVEKIPSGTIFDFLFWDVNIELEPTEFVFSGIIFNNEDDNSTLMQGRMSDAVGESTLHGVSLAGHKLTFKKVYDNRESEVINYTFEKHDDHWIGTYKWPNNPEQEGGAARCLVVPLPEKFLDPSVEILTKLRTE